MSNDHGVGITLTFTAALVGAAILLAAFWTAGAGGVSQPNQAHRSQPVPDWFLPIADHYDRNPAITPGFDFARLHDPRAAALRSFELVFDGRHEPAPESPVGLWHVGRFTASGTFCTSGNATTLGVTGTTPADAEATRLLTCDDGSGSATALVVSIDSEHAGSGNWRIISGTGPYEKLRGRGRFASVRTGGDPLDHGTITFRSTWAGAADLDDLAPIIAISKASAAKLRGPKGSYLLRVAFSAQDNPGNAVRFRVTVSGGKFTLASKSGETASGTASAVVRVRPAKPLRILRLEITASDPLGNESKVMRPLRLPS